MYSISSPPPLSLAPSPLPLPLQLHHVTDRRMVKGRSAGFEELAERHKQQRKSKMLEKLWADAGLHHMSSSRHSGGRDSPSR